MKAFYYVCFLFLLPGMLLRIPVGGAGIMGVDILLVLFTAFWIARKLVLNEKFPKLSWIKPGFIFSFIALASLLLNSWDLALKEFFVSFSYWLRLIVFLFWGWATVDIFKTEGNQKFLERIFGIGFLVFLFGFIQFFAIPDISNWSTEGGLDPHTGRLLGTWLDPNFMAGFAGFLMCLLAGFLYQYKKRRLWYWLLFLFIGVALFLTFSRGGYLAAAMGLGLFFLLRDPKVLLISIIAISIGIAATPRAQQRVGELTGTIQSIIFRDTDEIDPTANLRIQNWKKSFELFRNNPILGIGYNTYRYVASREGVVDESYFSAGGADSTHLTVLITTGIIGFLSYIIWLGGMIWTQWLLFWKEKSSLSLGLLCGIGALFVHAVFVNSFFFPLLAIIVFAVAAKLDPQTNEK